MEYNCLTESKTATLYTQFKRVGALKSGVEKIIAIANTLTAILPTCPTLKAAAFAGRFARESSYEHSDLQFIQIEKRCLSV